MTTIENTTDTKTNGKAKKNADPIRSGASETQDGIHAEYPLQYIPIDFLKPSPTQPRKKFSGIDELAESMKVIVLSPLIVRRIDGDLYEVADGERRLRAGKKAGLTHLPCSVRVLTDAQVVEIQLLSQGQREDLHPLEEADTYAMLQSKFGYSVDLIAAKTTKSTATIYNRLKLSALCPEARKAFLEDKISLAIALVLAKVADPAKQAEATAKVLKGRDGWVNETFVESISMSLEEARSLVVHEYTLVLKDATFDRADATLVAAAGACSSCPKRTGANPALFSDLESKDDLCTDAKCFQAKKDADWSRKSEAATKKGLKVLSDAEAKKIFAGGGVIRHMSAYVDLESKNLVDKKHRTNKALLGKKIDEVEIVIARDEDGNAHQLVTKKVFQSIAPASVLPAAVVDVKKEKEKREREQARYAAVRAKDQAKADSKVAEVVALAEKREPTVEWWRALARAEFDCAGDPDAAAQRRGLEYEDLAKSIDEMTPAQCRGLIVESVGVQNFKAVYAPKKKPAAKKASKAKSKR